MQHKHTSQTQNNDRLAHIGTLSSFDYSLAGAVSGMLTRVAIQPLDVIKIRFQVGVQLPCPPAPHICSYKLSR
jgi:hypothetical protein